MKIALLGKGLNSNTWGPLESHLKVKGLQYERLKFHSQISEEHSVVFSLGYDKIVTPEYLNKPKYGVVVFHSSDLPEGRGWSPLFYTIIKKKRFLVQSMFYADKGIDSGAIIAKASYPLTSFMKIADLRQVDDYLTCALFSKNIGILFRKRVKAKPQEHRKFTYWARRRPEDSRIKPNMRLLELYDFMRALPEDKPAFFEHKGAQVKLRLEIEPVFKFSPAKMVIKRYYSG